MSSPTAVIFMHEAHEGPHRLSPILERAGYALQLRTRELKPGDERAALVVVMGGPMAVYEADRYPFLRRELELLRGRLQRGEPSLGICLGAQLLAAAAGARVYPGGRGFELGVAPVRLSPEAAGEPALVGLPPQLDVPHWHGDTFDPVPGGQLLASSDAYAQQAFRVGRSYGLQFHPELDPPTLREWMVACPGDVARAGKTPETLFGDELPRLERAQPLLDRLLSQVVAAAAGSG